MGWDINEVRVDTLLLDDPRIYIGTITADKIVAGELEWDDVLVAPLREQDFF
jgi:hypothetical protein